MRNNQLVNECRSACCPLLKYKEVLKQAKAVDTGEIHQRRPTNKGFSLTLSEQGVRRAAHSGEILATHYARGAFDEAHV